MKRVIDASVVVKWFAEPLKDEENVHEALSLLRSVERGELDVIQPLHWKAEVISVLARRHSDSVGSAIHLMEGLELQVLDSMDVYSRAANLSVSMNHHLFDTLYHAVALELGAELVTADMKYYNKARGLGSISLLG